MANQKTIIGATLALAAVLLIASVLALIQSSKTVPSHGHVQGVSVSLWQDASCTLELTDVDWGSPNNGTNTDKTIYVKNDGTAAMTLNMTTGNWSPSNATNYLTITWDRETYSLANKTSVAAILTLSVSPSLTTGMDFTLDITITGSRP